MPNTEAPYFLKITGKITTATINDISMFLNPIDYTNSMTAKKLLSNLNSKNNILFHSIKMENKAHMLY